LNFHWALSGLELFDPSSTSAPEELSGYAEAIYESNYNYVAAMIGRRPTRHRSFPRDNRWRGTLPEANILIRKLLGLSTSKFLDTEFGSMDLPRRSNFGLRPFVRSLPMRNE
jgi:hypothetical protein